MSRCFLALFKPFVLHSLAELECLGNCSVAGRIKGALRHSLGLNKSGGHALYFGCKCSHTLSFSAVLLCLFQTYNDLHAINKVTESGLQAIKFLVMLKNE